MEKLCYQAVTVEWYCTAAVDPQDLTQEKKLPQGVQQHYQRSPTENPLQRVGPATQAPRRPYPAQKRHVDMNREYTKVDI